jgi:enterochelin esterase-like enzyme
VTTETSAAEITASLETLLERVKRNGTPWIDGETATFVWLGPHAPQLLGDFNNWGWGHGKPIELTQVAPEVWVHTETLRRDAYIEYTYSQDGQRVRDPLNPHTITNGMGAFNHFFRMPDSMPTPLVKVKPGVPRGKVTSHSVPGDHLIVGAERTIYLYQPPTKEPVPLLVVFDGQDYLHRARLNAIVDNLIAEGTIRPLALALVSHGGQARFVEYMCNDSTIFFLQRAVLPLAQQHLNLLDITACPGAYGVLGASMGGLMALYTGMRVPEVFGRVLSQSGSFRSPQADHAAVLFDLIQRSETKPLHIWMDVGRYEWLAEVNRETRDLLQSKGYNVTYREYPGEHNYTSWRDDIWWGLEALFDPENA